MPRRTLLSSEQRVRLFSIPIDAADELAADALEDPVVADKGASVGLGRSGGDVGQADLHGDDRLAKSVGLLRHTTSLWRKLTKPRQLGPSREML